MMASFFGRLFKKQATTLFCSLRSHFLDFWMTAEHAWNHPAEDMDVLRELKEEEEAGYSGTPRVYSYSSLFRLLLIIIITISF